MSRPRVPVSQDDLARAKALLEDGASQREVTRTTGISRTTLQKYFPGAGWTYVAGGEFRQLTKERRVA